MKALVVKAITHGKAFKIFLNKNKIRLQFIIWGVVQYDCDSVSVRVLHLLLERIWESRVTASQT